MEVHQSTIS